MGDVEKAYDRLTAIEAFGACSACGNTSFTVEPEMATLQVDAGSPQPLFDCGIGTIRKEINLLLVICSACGLVRLHAAGVLGKSDG